MIWNVCGFTGLCIDWFDGGERRCRVRLQFRVAVLAAPGLRGVRVAAIPAGQGSVRRPGGLWPGICREFEIAMAAARRVGGRRGMAAVWASHRWKRLMKVDES